MSYDVNRSKFSASCRSMFSDRVHCPTHLERWIAGGGVCEYCCRDPLCNLFITSSILKRDCIAAALSPPSGCPLNAAVAALASTNFVALIWTAACLSVIVSATEGFYRRQSGETKDEY